MLFSRRNEKRSLTLQDRELAKALGIEVDGISANKAKNATFFACLRILTDSVAKLPLKLYQSTPEGTQRATDHYLYGKMSLRPNINMTASDFWKAVEYQRSYFGHSVVVIETLPNGQVKALHPLDMSKLTIWIDDKAVIGKESAVWYVYNDGAKGLKFRNDEVLHFKNMTPDGIQGMAVKDYLNTTVENLQYADNYTNQYYQGGLSAKGILQYTGDIDPNAMNRMKQRFEDMATGTKNIGKILPVPLGFNFSTINTTMADAQFVQVNKLTIAQIAAAFGIKMHQLNNLEGAKFSNLQMQNEEFYSDTLLPILNGYEQELTYKLLTDKEIETGCYFKFNVDALLRADLVTRYNAYGIGIDKGFLTPNEARAKEDLIAAAGGDQLIVNGTYVKLQDVGQAYLTDEQKQTKKEDDQLA